MNHYVQHIIDNTPNWANVTIIFGSATLAWIHPVAWIQPVAGVIAIVWGLLQIYGWFERRWKGN